MARLVLTDASPLVGLSRVGGVVWLRELFGSVEMTAAVRGELERGGLEAQIAAAFDQGWLRSRATARPLPDWPPHLGEGEWSTIVAAREHRGPVLVLLDERLGRREARAAGLEVAGTAAIVGLAQKRGIIESARDIFEQLLRSDFRIAPEVARAVLDATEPLAVAKGGELHLSASTSTGSVQRPRDPASARSRC